MQKFERRPHERDNFIGGHIVGFALPPRPIEELLEGFFVGALGLTLEARIRGASDLLGSDHVALIGAQDQDGWCAWKTNQGLLSACGKYDHEQSQRTSAYVLLIEWSIAPHEHHKGWWHCYPKRPLEWIKGRGRN